MGGGPRGRKGLWGFVPRPLLVPVGGTAASGKVAGLVDQPLTGVSTFFNRWDTYAIETKIMICIFPLSGLRQEIP